MTLTSFNTNSNQSVGDTRSTDAPNGASAGAKAPAATSPSGGGGGKPRGKRGGGKRDQSGSASGRGRGQRGRGGGGRGQSGRGKGAKTSKTLVPLEFTVVIREASVSRAKEVALKDVFISAAVTMRKVHGSFNMNVSGAEAENTGSCEFTVKVFCRGDDTLLIEYTKLVHENVDRHNASVIVTVGSAAIVSATPMVVRASGGGAAASNEQEGVISVPMRGPRDLWMCRVKLALGLATESGHPFIGLAISLCMKYGRNKLGNVSVVDVTDTHFTIKARKEVIKGFRAKLLTLWVKFEMRAEADIGACELAARKVGKQINALDNVRANINTTGIKVVKGVAVVPCSVSLSAVDLFRDAFKTQITEVPSAPRGDDWASKKVRSAKNKISCESVENAQDYYASAITVAKKWRRKGDRVNVFAYDGKTGSEICIAFSCDAILVETFKEEVFNQVAFDDEKAEKSFMFEGCEVHRVFDSFWTKPAIECAIRQYGQDVSYMFTGRVMIFKNAMTGETALEEELPADVSRGRAPRNGPVPLWVETRDCAYSKFVLRSDSKKLTEEDEDNLVAEIKDTLKFFEENTFSIPYFDGKCFEALRKRMSVQFEKKMEKIKFQKGSLKGTTETEREVLKLPSWKHVRVLAKKPGKGPNGRTLEFVCEAASDSAKVQNFVDSVRKEAELLEKRSLVAKRIVRNLLPAARERIERKRISEKENVEKMALRKQQRKSVGTKGAPAMEKTPAPEHDSGDEEDATDFATSNPFWALLDEMPSVAATKGGAAMVEPKKMAPKKAKSKKGIVMTVDYGVVGSKGGRK